MRTNGISQIVRSIALVGLFVTSLASAAAQTSAFNLTVAPVADLPYTGTPGSFKSAAITLHVRTALVQWRLYMVSGGLSGSAGSFAPGATTMDITPETGATFAGTSMSFTGSQQPLCSGSLLAGNTEICGFTLSAAIPPLTEAGAAGSTLEFFYQNAQNNGPLVPCGAITYGVDVPTYTTVHFATDANSFNVPANALGNTLSTGYLGIDVETNDASGAQISMQVGPLVGPGGSTIPTSEQCVGLATTQAALGGINSFPLGQGATSPITLNVGYGLSSSWARFRLQTSYSDKPGVYAGSVLVIVTAN